MHMFSLRACMFNNLTVWEHTIKYQQRVGVYTNIRADHRRQARPPANVIHFYSFWPLNYLRSGFQHCFSHPIGFICISLDRSAFGIIVLIPIIQRKRSSVMCGHGWRGSSAIRLLKVGSATAKLNDICFPYGRKAYSISRTGTKNYNNIENLKATSPIFYAT